MKKIVSGLLAFSLLVLVGCATGSQPPAVGVWDAVLGAPQGEISGVVTLRADGSGEMSAPGNPSVSISGIVYEGNTAAFTAALPGQGQEIIINFTGAAEGDKLTGEFTSAFFSMSLVATRQ